MGECGLSSRSVMLVKTFLLLLSLLTYLGVTGPRPLHRQDRQLIGSGPSLGSALNNTSGLGGTSQITNTGGFFSQDQKEEEKEDQTKKKKKRRRICRNPRTG